MGENSEFIKDLDYLLSFFPNTPACPTFPREIMTGKTGGQDGLKKPPTLRTRTCIQKYIFEETVLTIYMLQRVKLPNSERVPSSLAKR